MSRIVLIIIAFLLLIIGAFFTVLGFFTLPGFPSVLNMLQGNFFVGLSGIIIFALGMVLLALDEIIAQLIEANKKLGHSSERATPKFSERR